MTRNTTHEIATHRILIVDDHPIVRRGLAQIINDQPDLEVCGEAESQAEALKLMVDTLPELIIVDVSLKDGSGIELIKQIKSRSPDAKMLVSSMHDESLFAERALRAGAMGYIDKQEATERTVEAIRHVLGGRVYLSSRMADRMLHRIVAGDAEPDRSPIESLSDRELEVFELIGQGLMTRQIAKKLHLSHKTIETYRENIKQKLNLKSGAELTRHALQWVLESK